MNPTEVEHLVWRFVRYQAVNIVTFVIDIALVFVLTSVFEVYYMFSVILGFMVSGVIGFFWNRGWTFRVQMHAKRGLAVSFFVGGIAFLIVLVLTYLGTSVFGLYYLLSRIIAAIFAAAWSYIGDSLYTFKVHPFRMY